MFDVKLEKNMTININNRVLFSEFIKHINKEHKTDLIILVPSVSEANKLYNAMSVANKNVYLFLEDDYITKKALISSPEFMYSRIQFLNNIEDENKKILITDINGFMKKLPTVKQYKEKTIYLKTSAEYNKQKLINNLVDIGYEKTSLVTEEGEFAVRGFVLDIFPINSEHPIRIEYFDDEIEKIKYFDIESQLTNKEIKSIKIDPFKDEYLDQTSNIINYLNNPLLIIQDKKRIDQVQDNINEQKRACDDSNYYDYKSIKSNNSMFINLLDYDNKGTIDLEAKPLLDKIDSIEKFKEFALSKNKNIILYTVNKKFIKELKNKNINIKYIDDDIESSFIYNDIFHISIHDIFNDQIRPEYKFKLKGSRKINNLTNIKVGDYIVHRKHGIGIYGGITTIERNKIKKDYLLIKYKGTDKLYLPVSSITTLYKYSSSDGKQPKINKLNSLEWKKTKHKIRNKIKDISKSLISVSKARNNIKVTPMQPKFPEEEIFENEFEYEITKDQLQTTREIARDLESNKPMDRLLCGDVGYGKTEVIFRSIFKAVLNGYQVIYLCPTTLLSNQQYNSAIKRFENFGLNIELLNRFTKQKDVTRIIKDLENGNIDLIFGTHKLFNEKIKYKNLGLLVIDEEHKFGVEHKEKIKQIKNNVHVLSVSATPIPRSLQMSLVGIRDMSLIETAPKNRFPVQTYVISYNDYLIKEVLLKELDRDGQAFVLYNNIKEMPRIQKKLKELLPNKVIEIAHGQMSSDKSEEIIGDFVDKKIDVLLTTTIIENGIDIPNANTIVVLDADRFGLSQLYQIRGRVGRSNRIAYAYFTYNPSKILNDDARKRLEAIKEFTELGSGYKLSMRDLSIRGAGDILGREQAGFIDSVGVDLYLELINDELNDVPEDEEEENINIYDVNTHIDDNYSEDDDIIIELHKKINNIKTKEDYNSLKKEIINRFGHIDNEIERYLEQELLEAYINELNINIIENNNYKISLMLKNDVYKHLNIEELFVTATRINSKINFISRGKNIIISLNKLNLEQDYLLIINEIMEYILNEYKKNKE